MVTNTTLSGGRGWLRSDAAASLARIDKALGHRLQITSAGRTRARQQYLYDLWKAGKGNYAAKPGTSPHESGYAIDSDEAQKHLSLMADHGWTRPLKTEPWHFLYRAANDKHRGEASGGGSSKYDAKIAGIQQALINDGIKVVKDGINGPKTISGIKTFQRKHGLAVDGIWGPKTNAMNNSLAVLRRPIIKKGSKNSYVTLLQKKLGIKQDGIFGPDTERAVKAFQKKNKLTPDGIVGRNTWQKIGY